MKKLFLAAFAVLTLNACTSPKDEEKKALDEIIKIHDKVMGFDEQLMKNKMKLDTILLEAKNNEAKEKIAVVFGNEVTGVEQSTLHLCDGCIEIPQLGMKHSLNIATATGVVLWELVRKML